MQRKSGSHRRTRMPQHYFPCWVSTRRATIATALETRLPLLHECRFRLAVILADPQVGEPCPRLLPCRRRPEPRLDAHPDRVLGLHACPVVVGALTPRGLHRQVERAVTGTPAREPPAETDLARGVGERHAQLRCRGEAAVEGGDAVADRSALCVRARACRHGRLHACDPSREERGSGDPPPVRGRARARTR